MDYLLNKFANILIRIMSKASDNILADLYLGCKNAYFMKTYHLYRIKYDIAESFRFNGDGILFYGDGTLCIGEKSYIGINSSISVVSGKKVSIGKACSISHNVRIYTSTNNSDQDYSISKEKIEGDVIIGDYVWIGANVFIGPGIKIGNNSIVGANSVVTKDVEPFSIVGGVPAKLIRYKTSKES